MKRRPQRQQHDLDRQYRHAAPCHHPEHRQHEARENVAVDGAAARADRLARTHHVRRVRRNRRSSSARNRLSRWRSFRNRRHAPAASRHGRPEPGAGNWRSWLPARCRPARRGNGEAAHTPPEWCSRLPARTPNAHPAAGSRASARVAEAMLASRASPTTFQLCLLPECISSRHPLNLPVRSWSKTRGLQCPDQPCMADQPCRMARTRSAARFPDRTDPSMVAGNPVSVQSPARNRFFRAVEAPGRRAFCSGVASKVARRSRTICQGGSSPLPRPRPCRYPARSPAPVPHAAYPPAGRRC